MATTVPATSYARDYNLPWVEKYRPHKVCDIVGNQDVVARLQVIAQGGNMPNLIFSVSSIRCCLYARIDLALHCCFEEEFKVTGRFAMHIGTGSRCFSLIQRIWRFLNLDYLNSGREV